MTAINNTAIAKTALDKTALDKRAIDKTAEIKTAKAKPAEIKPALIVMARWPAPGRCKRRLASGIGKVHAARIQSQLTNHTLHVARSIERLGLVELQLATTGLAPRAAARWGSSQGISKVVDQGLGCLGVRMRRQILKAQLCSQSKPREGRSTILIGTDLPELCQRDLLEALSALEQHQLVLGPADDGGYWLIGLSGSLIQPVATWPFCGIPWGTEQVLPTTMQRAELAGITPALLRQQNDLDQLDDLAPWQA
ncbi:MAG: TIGR04282 family arsenosugar biosynthesis glycosyltransferase [Prochlorococcus sp.]